MSLPVIKGPYWADIQAQPAALDATLEELSRPGLRAQVQSLLHARVWRRIVLTGMGSSGHALYGLHLHLTSLGLPSLLMETAELVHYGEGALTADTLIIAVSQSGASAEAVRLLEIQGKSRVLGITNTAGSPLATSADLTLLLNAGPEHSVSCKTYVATLLILRWLGGVFAQQPDSTLFEALSPAVRLTREYLSHWREHVKALTAQLRVIEHIFLLGRGASLASALTGALIVKESARVHAEAMSSAAYRHGPMEMARADMLTCVFLGDERTRSLNERLVEELISSGQRVAQIGSGAVIGPWQLPPCTDAIGQILEILPVQMMTLALAALASREAGAFERARKITDTE